jgi:hypothetical protein
MTLVSQANERANAAPTSNLAEQAQRSRLVHSAQQAQLATIGIAVAGGAVLAGAIALLAGSADPQPSASTDVEVTVHPVIGPAYAGVTLGF